jgi:hypothetical protein
MAQNKFSDDPIEDLNEEYNPLAEDVIQRDYTNNNMGEPTSFEELEEPEFTPPSFEDFEEDTNTGKNQDFDNDPEPLNPKFNDLDNKEKTMGAKMMVEMSLDLYAKGCGLLGKLPEISESKLDRFISEGEIDGNIEIPTENGNLNIKEFAKEYNDAIKESFEVSDEFREKVREPLERIFKKRGVGLTDEQLVLYYIATDFGTKAVQAFMLKKNGNSIIKSLKENTLAIKEQNAQLAQAQNPVTMQTPVTEPEPKIVYSEPISATPKTNFEEQISTFDDGNEIFSTTFAENSDFAEATFDKPPKAPKPKKSGLEIILENEGKEVKKPTRKRNLVVK